MLAPSHQEQPTCFEVKPQGAPLRVVSALENMTHYVVAIQKTVMPELYTSMPSSPQIHVLYLAPGQEIITPEQLMASEPERIAKAGGGGLLKVSPTMAVKYGTHTSLIEAKTMLYVAEKTSIPIPKVFAAYAYGPLKRDLPNEPILYETYIFMEFIEGEDLEKSWSKCTPDEKQMITADLKKYMTELRSLPAPHYIGSVHGGPVTDTMFEWSTNSRGPFESVEDFHATTFDTYNAKSKRPHMESYIRGMMSAKKYAIVFTHGDFYPRNIIVKDGRVKAVIDWEMAGWYPEYWEFAKAFWLERFTNDWAPHLLSILTPYYLEHMLYEKLMYVLR